MCNGMLVKLNDTKWDVLDITALSIVLSLMNTELTKTLLKQTILHRDPIQTIIDKCQKNNRSTRKKDTSQIVRLKHTMSNGENYFTMAV